MFRHYFGASSHFSHNRIDRWTSGMHSVGYQANALQPTPERTMTRGCQQTFGFQALGSRRVETDFSGGHLSSDGGVLLLRETDRRLSLCDRLARCFSDTRDERFVEHSLPVRIRQRGLGLALG